MPDQIYMVRDDLTLALPDNPFNITHEAISDRLKSLLEKAIPAEVSMMTVKVEDQLAAARIPGETISLDCFWSGTYNLQVTRLFQYGDNQDYSLKLTNRPGTQGLASQVKLIPAGEYILVDDDISTGRTMVHVSEMLALNDIHIVGRFSLIPKTNNLFDVVDLRDFILGTQHGGLTVEIGEMITRLPYIHPYVNLVTRAKLSMENAKFLSKELWKLNYDLYVETPFTLGDIEERQAFTFLGFSPKMRVADFCKSQLKILENQPV